MNETYAACLRSRGFRLTPQRIAILNILEHADCHLSAIQIYECARQSHPGITEATIYRTLSFLVEQGLALAAHLGGGQLVYENALRQHHHLICRSCSCSCEIDHELLDELYHQFQEKTGYQVDATHLTFFGLCPACQTDRASSP
jgi:Fe2+ or Zn2+ uptake regulation protein